MGDAVAGADNKRQLCELVDAGVVPGLIGYVDGVLFGSRALYERAGFTEVVRRSPTRVVMRLNLAEDGG